MPWKGVNAERCSLEVRRVPSRKQLNHVLQIEKSVVHWSSSEQIELLTFAHVKHRPVVRQRDGWILAFQARISEVVCLVDDNDIRKFPDSLQSFWVFARSKQVRVIVNGEVAVFAE